MRIVMTGASGYIGQVVSEKLKQKNYAVEAIPRELLYGSPQLLSEKVKGAFAVVNLAGAPVLQYWNAKNRKAIYSSRVDVTKNLVEAVNMLQENQKPKIFISASAIGIYKTGTTHDESSTIYDTGFLGKVVKDWEDASLNLDSKVQRVIFRIGLVLGKKAKTIKSLILPFKLGLGATIGNGKQPFPFIHVSDVAEAFSLAVETGHFKGTYNLVAPENIDNKKFTKTFGRILKRPAFLFIPKFFFRLVYGKAASLITNSPAIVPQKLMNENFPFSYPSIEKTLNDILKNHK